MQNKVVICELNEFGEDNYFDMLYFGYRKFYCFENWHADAPCVCLHGNYDRFVVTALYYAVSMTLCSQFTSISNQDDSILLYTIKHVIHWENLAVF